MVPQDLRHTRERERARMAAPGTVRVGATGHAQWRLGDAVFVHQPVPGALVAAGRMTGAESTGSALPTSVYHTELTEQG